jgi:hypothetical protein
MSKHTKGPWKLNPSNKDNFWQILAAVPGKAAATEICIGGGSFYSPPKAENDANGAYILRACNSHDDLLAACEAALCPVVFANQEQSPPGHYDKVEAMLRAAIAKAKG